MAKTGVMIAGLASGSGKTLISLGLLGACVQRSLSICAAKTGPDFIDTAFLTAAGGSPAINLDGYAMPAKILTQLAHDQPGETMIIEGVMGLFDGGSGGVGSSAEIASALAVPIILVLDVRHTAQTAAIVVAALNQISPAPLIAGVILNRVASAQHQMLISEALDSVGVPLVGALPNDEKLQIPSRHLGLVQAGDLALQGQLSQVLDGAAQFVEAHCDVATIMRLAMPITSPGISNDNLAVNIVPPPAQHIAIAKDAAFGFCYEHLLQWWRQQGATISVFSPLNDEAPANDAEFIYIPGGYPELHLPALSTAQNFFAGLRQAASLQRLIYGECGGYMMLGAAITGADGTVFKMANLLDLHTSFAVRKRHLGYRKFIPRTNFFWPGVLRGHEFHYTTAIYQRGTSLFDAEDSSGAALGSMGLQQGSVSGSYGHVIAMV